ncbi:MAG: hypothetical protein Q7K29_00970 [Thermoleophilia bacterium]|nr:hypothetical protein [Thermoleophilia bacterium]
MKSVDLNKGFISEVEVTAVSAAVDEGPESPQAAIENDIRYKSSVITAVDENRLIRHPSLVVKWS